MNQTVEYLLTTPEGLTVTSVSTGLALVIFAAAMSYARSLEATTAARSDHPAVVEAMEPLRRPQSAPAVLARARPTKKSRVITDPSQSLYGGRRGLAGKPPSRLDNLDDPITLDARGRPVPRKPAWLTPATTPKPDSLDRLKAELSSLRERVSELEGQLARSIREPMTDILADHGGPMRCDQLAEAVGLNPKSSSYTGRLFHAISVGLIRCLIDDKGERWYLLPEHRETVKASAELDAAAHVTYRAPTKGPQPA